ncbi:hypothetical protein GRS96_11665 [Rathayibacter sp. VKM Ac-2803]|uniref:hypothetical protein n=1 Tax=unclassified Rathayibacter TaxID=2609250 RepID=UPI00135CBAAB|nr:MULTISPECIES: hypothetical protein [unclassified Rathayibacter]MWV49928.1 hypothetical protein [Rathayibacter sp. VKM Ac-2803]MWV58060.1 hypothetical protein [Rathayibacter sp. VKM Ac-2754]
MIRPAILISGRDAPTDSIQAVRRSLEQGHPILRGADRREVDATLALMVQTLHRAMTD